ncbi:MAG: T9SS type A sorting domain-containing protein [Flavobacteriales bacterium]
MLPEHQNEAGGHTFAYIPFTEPYPLYANSEVMPCLISLGGSNVRYANSGTSPDNTTFIYGNGAQGMTWYYTTVTPMVRLMLASVPMGVEDLVNNSLTLGGNVPNPFNHNTTIQYQLSYACHVSITVRDVDGKVVMSQDLGTRASGRYAYDIDATGLASGIYSYTLTAGGDHLTRRMVVAK